MSHSASSQTRSEPREFMVRVELHVSTSAASLLRKAPTQKKKSGSDKRDVLTSSRGEDSQKKVKEKTSWMSLARNPAGPSNWRLATCRLAEEGDKCVLNIYLDDAILYQKLDIDKLSHTDIRLADSSMVHRKDCLAIYCEDHQRWTSAPSDEPVYLQFPNTDACNTWLALLRSYAIPEVYGSSYTPGDGGLYRMWRQVDLKIMSGRGLGNQKPLIDSHQQGIEEPDAVDLDVYCEIRFNDQLCGRTTVKKGIGSPDWHESFMFSDLPPFETLEITLLREKKLPKPTVMGSVRIALSNFRRGEVVEGWFPVIFSGPIASGIQVGDIRMSITVDEEIVLPHIVYSSLLQTINSRNILDWMEDFEHRLHLKSISNPLISIALAKNTLIDEIFQIANQEVDGTPHSHNTLFRGNTTLTKTMERCMGIHGKPFLEASIGSVIRRLCNEKVAIDVDNRGSNNKSSKEIEKNVDLLIHWCREFWKQIYSVRGECPQEMRRLLEHIRKLVETHYNITENSQDKNRELPSQSVSAFCFLRFIVPGILHPHLFGLCPGLPSLPVQQSLKMIAKVIQSLANLSITIQKEDQMGGVKTFLQDNQSQMVDYIRVVSSPVIDPHGPQPGSNVDNHDRLKILSALRVRGRHLSVLDKESIPLLPHLIDVPRHLAVVTSAVIRNSKGQQYRRKPSEFSDGQLDEFIAKCIDVEEQALHRVSSFAAQRSSLDSDPHLPPCILPPSSSFARFRKPSLSSSHSIHQSQNTKRVSRPTTGPDPSQSDLSDAPHQGDISSDVSLPASPVHYLDPASPIQPRLVPRGSHPDMAASLPEDRNIARHSNKGLKSRSTSTDSMPSYTAQPPVLHKAIEPQTEISDDAGKKTPKRGILRGILTRR